MKNECYSFLVEIVTLCSLDVGRHRQGAVNVEHAKFSRDHIFTVHGFRRICFHYFVNSKKYAIFKVAKLNEAYLALKALIP